MNNGQGFFLLLVCFFAWAKVVVQREFSRMRIVGALNSGLRVIGGENK